MNSQSTRNEAFVHQILNSSLRGFVADRGREIAVRVGVVALLVSTIMLWVRGAQMGLRITILANITSGSQHTTGDILLWGATLAISMSGVIATVIVVSRRLTGIRALGTDLYLRPLRVTSTAFIIATLMVILDWSLPAWRATIPGIVAAPLDLIVGDSSTLSAMVSMTATVPGSVIFGSRTAREFLPLPVLIGAFSPTKVNPESYVSHTHSQSTKTSSSSSATSSSADTDSTSNSAGSTSESETVDSQERQFDAHDELDGSSDRGGHRSESEPARKQSSPRTSTDGGDSDTGQQSFKFDWSRPELTFWDVGGRDQVKADIEQRVLKPFEAGLERTAAFGIDIPNILFHGPPGTGKTHLAGAMAGELDRQVPNRVEIAKLSAADLTSKWVNEGPQLTKRLFEEATYKARQSTCVIIFIDEAESILRDRSGQAHEETKKIVDEWLNHLEDTGATDTGGCVMVVAATNRRDQMDPAATRSGRISTEFEIGLPDVHTRMAILATQMQDRPGELDRRERYDICHPLEGATAADIESLVDDAARHALFERNGHKIRRADFQATLFE